MKKCSSIIHLFFLLLTIFVKAQNNTEQPNNSETKVSEKTKLIKNNFPGRYPGGVFLIQCAVQDKSGNLWFGTNFDGVYRYDGKNFTNFSTKNGLCNNDVLSILEDTTGGMWFGTRSGLCHYEVSNTSGGKEIFSTIHVHANGEDKYNQNFVWSMLEDKNGTLWFATINGVYFWNRTKYPNHNIPVFEHFLKNDSISNPNNLHLQNVLKICEDKKGNIWFVSGDMEAEGICLHDGKSIRNLKPEGQSSFRSLLECANGDFLIISQKGKVYKLKNTEITGLINVKDFIPFSNNIDLKEEIILSVLEDKAGNIWFGTESNSGSNNENSGLWRYDGKTLESFADKDSLSQKATFCLLQDRDGLIWIGRRTGELLRYDGKDFINFSE